MDYPPSTDDLTKDKRSSEPATTPLQYDYSRASTSSNGNSHWYGLPGQKNPLADNDTRATDSSRKSQIVRSTTNGKMSAVAQSRSRQRQQRRLSGMPDQWSLMVIGGTLLLLVIMLGGFLMFLFNQQTPSTANAVQPTLPPPVYSQTQGTSDAALLPSFNPLEIQPWNGNERFTLVVMGLDNRPGEEGSCRSDTIMVMSIDPVQKRIGILSIPRDIYVDVPPNFGLRQINQICTIGNLNLNNGPELVMQTIQYNFGIPIHDYLMIDFFSFIKFIDHIGGVDMVIENTIDDPEYPDMYYGFDPFYLEAGLQHLDGETALKYARSRHTSAGGDLDRAARQQRLIFAIREKVLNFNLLDELLANAPQIWQDLEAGIDTGLEFEQLLALIVFARDVSTTNMLSGVVSSEYVIGYQTEWGWALVPRRDSLVQLMTTVFGENYHQQN